MEWNEASTEQEWFLMDSCTRPKAWWEPYQTRWERWRANPHIRIVGKSKSGWIRPNKKDCV